MNPLPTEPGPAANSAVPGNIDPPPFSTEALPRSAVDKARTRILYVEDDSGVRRLGKLLLARSGYEVDTADDGTTAWAVLQAREYHLLITDNLMPGLTGLELIRKLRVARMHMPVILVSGTIFALLEDELPELECGAMLAKPFTAEQLISAVHEVLRAAVSPRTPAGVRVPVLEEFRCRFQPHQAWGINE